MSDDPRPAKGSRSARKLLGAFGERIAAHYLEAHGYRIIDRNVRTAAGEIDIVAVEADVTAFIEVRTRRGGKSGLPEETIRAVKARRLALLAEAYLDTHPETPPAGRVDVIAIELAADGLVQRVDHIKDIITD